MSQIDRKNYFIGAGYIDMSPSAVAVGVIERRGPFALAYGRQWRYVGYLPEGISRDEAWKQVSASPEANQYVVGVRPDVETVRTEGKLMIQEGYGVWKVGERLHQGGVR